VRAIAKNTLLHTEKEWGKYVKPSLATCHEFLRAKYCRAAASRSEKSTLYQLVDGSIETPCSTATLARTFASAIDNHSHLGHLRGAAWYRTSLMIVCVCNRLSEAKIRGAIACGASSPDHVYAHNGVRRICGTCQETIAAMLQEHEPQEQLQAAE
jgi:bacterioferritin-associated ferredoxin